MNNGVPLRWSSVIADQVGPELAAVINRFEKRCGANMVWVVRCPARLCLVADHTDYHEWFSPELITFASNTAVMTAIITPLEEKIIKIHSSDVAFDSYEISFESGPERSLSWLEWLAAEEIPEPNWSNYVEGVLRHAQSHYGDEILFGFEMFIDSTIPVASGASSSSALTMCAALALRQTNKLPLSPDVIAAETADAEWFVGTRGGMMDHATMAYAEQSKVLNLSFNPFAVSSTEIDTKNASFVTIFTHPSEKGGEVARAFNELALIAREITPALLAEQGLKCAAQPVSLDQIKPCEEATCNELSARFPEIAKHMQTLYPQLYDTPDRPMKIADRIQFGRNEWLRCQEMKPLISSGNLTGIGKIMDAAWQESGSLYGIRTDAMDAVANVVKSVNGVYGVKVMGAGFGGNLLALIENASLSKLANKLEKAGSSGLASGVMMVHGVGRGLHFVDAFSSHEWNGNEELAAIILCGGKGTRMRNQGVETHKPLLPINGVPSTKLVIERLQNKFEFKQIIVVVPPERVGEYEAVLDDDVEIRVQPVALGTGDAVHSILSYVDENVEHLLVTFGSQPLVRDTTLAASLKHHIDGGFGMTLPTTKTMNPYAPLVRDENGDVTCSLETHLDGVEMPDFGETNIGAYWVTKSALDDTLNQLWGQKWDEEEGKYRTLSGELGFPNEMVDALVAAGIRVDGLAVSDPEEVIGIKTPGHIEIIEKIEARRRRWD